LSLLHPSTLLSFWFLLVSSSFSEAIFYVLNGSQLFSGPPVTPPLSTYRTFGEVFSDYGPSPLLFILSLLKRVSQNVSPLFGLGLFFPPLCIRSFPLSLILFSNTRRFPRFEWTLFFFFFLFLTRSHSSGVLKRCGFFLPGLSPLNLSFFSSGRPFFFHSFYPPMQNGEFSPFRVVSILPWGIPGNIFFRFPPPPFFVRSLASWF